MAQVRQEKGREGKKISAFRHNRKREEAARFRLRIGGERVLFEKKPIMVIPDPTKSKAV